jgi:urease accessory protein UreE
MILISRVLGHCDDAFWSGLCDHMEQCGRLEMLTVDAGQLMRRQVRARTDKGTVVGVNLGDSLSEEGGLPHVWRTLRPGSVVFYEENQRVVLAQLKDARVLVIASLNRFSPEDAIALGHYFGCLGWPVRTRRQPTHVEIFIDCAGDEDEMENAMRLCPLPNISWTFRDRRASDPLPARQ